MENRLKQAVSPYLRGHAENPIHWHEWGSAAFAEARERDVPILLSVGYSSCHWCHARLWNTGIHSDCKVSVSLVFEDRLQKSKRDGEHPSCFCYDVERLPHVSFAIYCAIKIGAQPS